MRNEYTIAQACKDALQRIPCGTDFHGYDYIRACRHLLAINGNPAKPYDDTLLRYKRQFASLYGIKLKDRAKSIYHKEDRQGVLGL